ncbi:unnamed protein product [Calypogeia fissa]
MALPYVKDLPSWMGETGMTSVVGSYVIFQIRDAQFSLKQVTDPWWTTVGYDVTGFDSFEGDADSSYEDLNSSGERRSERQFWLLYASAMSWVSRNSYDRALADLCVDNSGLVVPPWLQGFVLQQTGMIKISKGDLTGALKDLTTAVGIFSEASDLRCYACDCWKHRGLVNFLLGNFDEAQKDREMVLIFYHKSCGDPNDIKGEKLSEGLVNYMHSIIKGWGHHILSSSHSQVMEIVRQADYSKALAVWNCFFDVQFRTNVAFYLQERGILKRLTNDLEGALEDLTAALEIIPKDYECLKHSAYVKYLLEDEDGARVDAEQALAMGRIQPGDSHLGEFPVTFLEFDL